MRKTICEIDCEKCEACGTCRGCSETGGRPFDGECIVAECYTKGETAFAELKERLIAEFIWGTSYINTAAAGVMGLLQMKHILWQRNTANAVPMPKSWYLRGGIHRIWMINK